MTSLEFVWKATAILAAAFAAGALMRRSPAALRHFLWTAAFAALLVLPAAMLLGPKWSAPVALAVQAVELGPSALSTPAPSVPATSQPRPPFSLAAIWWTGFLLAAARFLAGATRTSWIAARARPTGIEDGVPLLETPLAPVPMTWGIFRPVILLPAGASAWPADRLRVVLLHELTHVRRRDLLAQSIAQAACCLYWFHPLAWLALRELRKERERACDDSVLATGVAPHEYAGHVMDLVRTLAARRGPLSGAPAMAETSGLEARIRAMLDTRRNRRPLPPRAALAVAAAALAALLPLASVTALAQAATGTLAGTVNDPSGARIPDATVNAINLEGGNRETTKADLAGEFRFSAIPAGRYTLEFAARGFKLGKLETTLVAGAVARLDAFLEIGGISERLVVKGGSKPTTPPAPANAVPQRIRVGGNVSPARLVRQPRPFYAPDLQQAGIEGTVRLMGVVLKDGSLGSVRVVNTVDSRLAQAALDAVRQWRYQPSRLNGEPVETVTTIDLQFQLGQ